MCNFSDEPNWMKEKFGNLTDAAFPQQFAPMAGEVNLFT
jgi:hypothetical protein